MAQGKLYVQGPTEIPRRHTINPVLVYKCTNCGKELIRTDMGNNRSTYKHRD